MTNYLDLPKPLDLLDRSCQIYQACIGHNSSKNHKCFCDEQLYYHVSNFEPTDNITKHIKDNVLYYLQITSHNCSSYYHFDKIQKLGSHYGLPIYPKLPSIRGIVGYNITSTNYTSLYKYNEFITKIHSNKNYTLIFESDQVYTITNVNNDTKTIELYPIYPTKELEIRYIQIPVIAENQDNHNLNTYAIIILCISVMTFMVVFASFNGREILH